MNRSYSSMGYIETGGRLVGSGAGRISTRELWSLVNIPCAVTLGRNNRSYGPPPGERGTLKRFGHTYAIVAFPDYAPLEFPIVDLVRA